MSSPAIDSSGTAGRNQTGMSVVYQPGPSTSAGATAPSFRTHSQNIVDVFSVNNPNKTTLSFTKKEISSVRKILEETVKL